MNTTMNVLGAISFDPEIRGILVVLEDGNILDTILYYIGSAASRLPALLSAYAMYIVQMLLNGNPHFLARRPAPFIHFFPDRRDKIIPR